MTTANPLRLMAQDDEDLQVISAAVQDAVSQVGNFAFKTRQRRFTLELNRFRWEHDGTPRQRVRAILSIDNVLAARVRGLPQNQPQLVISVLQLRFEPGESEPEGQVLILLSGDGEIALDVEALDVTLLDSETAWPTRKTPRHGKD